MTDPGPDSSAATGRQSDGAPAGKLPTHVTRLRFQPVVNRIARALLRVPVISRVVGNGLVTLYVVGPKSGKRYTIPMAYIWHEGDLLLGSGFAWGKNLRTGEPLELRFKGRKRVADVRVIEDQEGVITHYTLITRRNPGFAKINKIGSDANGIPDRNDLESAWRAGARVFLLSLR